MFIYLWLCWVFVSVRGFSPVAASGGHASSRCVGLSLSQPLLLRSTGSRRAGSIIVAHGLSCSAACGIFPDQGSNPCPLHWQADSQPLHHQGSLTMYLFRCWINLSLLLMAIIKSLVKLFPFSFLIPNVKHRNRTLKPEWCVLIHWILIILEFMFVNITFPKTASVILRSNLNNCQKCIITNKNRQRM